MLSMIWGFSTLCRIFDGCRLVALSALTADHEYEACAMLHLMEFVADYEADWVGQYQGTSSSLTSFAFTTSASCTASEA